MIRSVTTTLGTDLLLLAIDRQRSRLRSAADVDIALAGAVLVELALAGRILIDGKQVTIRSGKTTGDARLDPALEEIVATGDERSLYRWVIRLPRSRLRADHLEALTRQGAVRTQRLPRPLGFSVTEVVVLDPLRLADVRARLDRMAATVADHVPVQPADRALAGLTDACLLTGFLYPGRANRQARRQLKQLATAHPAGSEIDAAIDATVAAVRRAVANRRSG